MVDKKGQLWVNGENTHGCLGTTDVKHRQIPQVNSFFENKRIVDIACGDRFSIIIAETYDLSDLEQEPQARGQSDKLEIRQKAATGGMIPPNIKEAHSTKMNVAASR